MSLFFSLHVKHCVKMNPNLNFDQQKSSIVKFEFFLPTEMMTKKKFLNLALLKDNKIVIACTFQVFPCVSIMVIQVLEFSSGGFKIRKMFA